MADSAVQEPYKLTLGDGSVVQGANMEEALKNLAKMKEDTAVALKQAREEAQRYQQEATQLRQSQQRKSEPIVDGKFNSEKYFEIFNRDPMEAQDYLDAHRFGIPQNEVRPTFNHLREQVSVIEQKTVLAEFNAQHANDFPYGKESATRLTERVAELRERGLPFNVDTLNYAYQQLVAEQVLKPIEDKEDEKEPPNPSLTGGGGVSADLDYRKAEQMSDKELEAELRKRGAL